MTLQRGDFQTFVNTHFAHGVVGGFASMNPRAVALAGPGAFVADSDLPVVVGYFAWATISDGVAYGAQKANSQLGFVGNEGQTVITDFLGVSRLSIQAGFPVTLYTHGDFWTECADVVAVGDEIYADAQTGQPQTSSTTFSGTATTTNASTTLTINSTVSGELRVGDVLVGTDIPTGTTIASFGTYTVSAGTGTVVMSAAATGAAGPGALTVAAVDTGFIAQTAAPAAATASQCTLDAQGVLTVGGSVTGTIEIGDGHDVVVNGTGVPANTFIASQLTGTAGGAGTYQTTSLGTTISSNTAMTFTTGTLVKIGRTY